MCSAGSRKWLISCSSADTKYKCSKTNWCRLTCAYFVHVWLLTKSYMSICIRYKARTSSAKFDSFCWPSNLGQIYQKKLGSEGVMESRSRISYTKTLEEQTVVDLSVSLHNLSMMLVWNNLADPHLSPLTNFARFSQTLTLNQKFPSFQNRF